MGSFTKIEYHLKKAEKELHEAFRLVEQLRHLFKNQEKIKEK